MDMRLCFPTNSNVLVSLADFVLFFFSFFFSFVFVVVVVVFLFSFFCYFVANRIKKSEV